MSVRDRQVGGNHYADKPIQPWDVMEQSMSKEEFCGFLRGCVIKYTMRCRDKGGVQDLAKAQHCLEKLLEVITNG
jgi:hypothetical protein